MTCVNIIIFMILRLVVDYSLNYRVGGPNVILNDTLPLLFVLRFLIPYFADSFHVSDTTDVNITIASRLSLS
jgi:hypothetical protein